MKLLYLGTAAAEGIPAVFCLCHVCMTAREKKGKEIRTRSQALLDGKILFDFPPDSYCHYITGIAAVDSSAANTLVPDLPAIRHIFITHSHMDHFYPDELQLRKPGFVTHRPVETLHIYGNRKVENKLLELQKDENAVTYNKFHYAEPFRPIGVDNYLITPFPALHDRSEECLFFAAEHDSKTLLYAHDTGFFPEPVWQCFSEKKMHFDAVSLDCTTAAFKDGNNHMGIADCIDVRQKLISTRAADDKTIFVLNHFSHNGGLNHDELCERTEKEGFIVAYDGLEIIV